MLTTIRTYCIFTNTPEGAKEWRDLRTKLEKTNGECFESWGVGSMHYKKELTDKVINLEPKHIFDNQWNTADGLRVFDWAQDYMPYRNPNLKQGHYLEITQEMRDIRNDTVACGYCGFQSRTDKPYFCPQCLGSQYLKAEDIHLTRLQPVSCKDSRKPLSEAEKAERMPLYIKAQTERVTERDKKAIARARESVVSKCDKVTADSITKRDGFLWLLDRGFRTDNVIFYTHTGRFCFGWRSPLSGELLSRTLDIITEFPFDYDIKKAE